MATVRSGQIRTGVSGYDINQDRRVPDWLSKIFTYDPKSSPMLTVLMDRKRTMKAGSWKVNHLEDEPVPDWDTENGGGINNSATSMTVSNGGYHQIGDILMNLATGEGVRVEGVSTNVLTISRGYVGSAAAVASGQQLLNLGKGEPEGASSPDALHTQTTTKENFTQIKKEPVDLSRTADQINLYGGGELARQRRKAAAKHAREWEQVLIWGKKKNDTTGTQTGATNRPIRLAGGLNEHITTNELDLTSAGGVLSENALREFVGDCSRYRVDGSDGRKVLIAGRAVIDTIESWGANKLQTRPGGNRYGFNIQTWVSTYGEVDVVWHPLLELGSSGYGFIVDMAGIMGRPLQRTVLQTNIQANDIDGQKDQYLTEMSFSFINEKAFGRIKGATFGS